MSAKATISSNLPVDLPSAHAQNAAVQVDVFPPGQLRMKAGSDLEQAADPAAERRTARRRLGDPTQDLEQRRLAGSIAADDADDLSGLDLEGDVLECPMSPSSARAAAFEAVSDPLSPLQSDMKRSVIDSRSVR